ncbi:MAG: CAP domain-containing protein [Clostridiales bacterium]|nr:CAP domain-containing protein [Clostridiales bacterium]
MKKLLITSACTLLLSLFGTLGANNEAFNIKEDLSNKLNTENAEQADTVEENDTELTIEEDTNTTDAEEETTDTVEENTVVENDERAKEEVETPSKVKEKTPTSASAKKNTEANKAPKANKTQKTNQTQNTNKESSKNEYIKPASTITNGNTKLNSDNINDIKYDSNEGCYTLNGKVIAYGNINPSELGSIEDIIAKFKDSGYNVELPNNNTGNSNPSKPSKPVEEKPVEQPTKPTPAPSKNEGSNNNSSFANQVLQLVNVERSKAGLSKLTMDSTLSAAAQKRAVETETSFSHTRPNGTKFSTVLAEYGISYRTSGENLAYGQRSPEEVVTGWMNSPGHRANILNGNFNKIGIGVHSSNGTIYWSQLFTN